MKTKIFTIFFALVASVGTMFAESGTCGENLTWDLTDGVLTISGKGPMEDYGYRGYEYIVVPWQSLKSSIIYIYINGGVTYIGEMAFCGCSNLTSVTIPNSVIGIGERAFDHCESMTSLTIPNSVSSIGSMAFYACTDLTSVTIPNSVTKIENGTFGICTDLTSVTIPNSVASIGGFAFEGCRSLTSVTIPNSVKTIGGYAFSDCRSLTSVTIPNSVTSIGEEAFKKVPNIVYNGTATGSPWGARSVNGYVEGWLVYSDNTKTNLLACSASAIGEITIPNSVTSIGNEAFLECESIISVTIPNSVTNIGKRAFSGCTGLTSVTIPNSVTSIGDGAFGMCTGLTSVTIPNSVTSIGIGAFVECTGLTSVIIPNSVTWIGYAAFVFCTGLASITCETLNPPALGESVFEGVDKSIPLYVPEESINAYKAADQWKDFTNILAINLENINIVLSTPKDNSTKFLRNGQVLIERGDKTYTLQGQQLK